MGVARGGRGIRPYEDREKGSRKEDARPGDDTKACFPARNDELYANLKWQPKETAHIRATAWDDHALYTRRRQPTPGAGLDQPVSWTRDYGAGRVFVTALGHAPENCENRGFQVTFARGAEWAATGNVTLAVPADMAE